MNTKTAEKEGVQFTPCQCAFCANVDRAKQARETCAEEVIISTSHPPASIIHKAREEVKRPVSSRRWHKCIGRLDISVWNTWRWGFGSMGDFHTSLDLGPLQFRWWSV